MIDKYLQQALSLYDKTDAILITNKEGIIEYSTMVEGDHNSFITQEVNGQHVLDVYPTLTEATSDIMQVLKSGKPIVGYEQELVDYAGKKIHIRSSSYPIISSGEIIGVINAAVYQGSHDKIQGKARLVKENRLYSLEDIITCNHEMMTIKEKAKRIADSNSNVLISGETGTGKELFAQSIHSMSRRSSKPFVSQNCAAIPENLLEGLLFGTTKGSFTGAEDKKGLFEVADGGTVFLDEINSMDISLQSKLLKAIEEKKVYRIGDYKAIPVDIRIISAMNESADMAMEGQKIREDLYYRIGVVQLDIPPLRQRKDDVLLLMTYYIKHFNKEMNREIMGISELVKSALTDYNWPGNVRELRNVIESAFNLAGGSQITMQDIPDYLMKRKVAKANSYGAIKNASLPQLVENYEKDLIQMTIENVENLVEASKLLGISRQSLQYKMHKYNLTFTKKYN